MPAGEIRMPAPDRSASRHTPAGAAGRNVIVNVERLRAARHLSLRQLSDRLGELGRPMLPSVVHAITAGKRRVDADDLVALAAVLGVSPADLLASPDTEILAETHPALREVRSLASRVEEVLAGPGDPVSARRLERALTRVRLEVEELLEGTAARPERAG